jgi:trigger factor
MQINKSFNSETEAVLTVSADNETLSPIKDSVLKHLRKHVKIQGFREGKAPLSMVEKNTNQETLHTEFLNEAINRLYSDAIRQENLRPVDNPQVSITKFVPFSNLEFQAVVQVVSDIKLADYTKIKKKKPEVSITADDIKEVIESLRLRLAEKKDVQRVAKSGDQVWIDFSGTDTKGEPVKGADGKDYPLALGSNTFIPGFEDNIVGLKAGDEKTFTLTFPKDYGVKALANKKVTFNVTVTKVQEVVKPAVDDNFAKQVGPFKSLKDLKEDIKKQLKHERQHQVDRDFESELIMEVSSKSKLSVPETMIAEQVERLMQELQQNLMYRGQTIQEFLEAEGKTEESYKNEILKPQAEERVKAGLVLSEIAEKEHIDVTPEELDIRIQVLKGQYTDDSMQQELDKPENRKDIASRILTEKTISKIVSYAVSK